ncbi:hypothetical protein D3C75_718320 [compost metagenome]
MIAARHNHDPAVIRLIMHYLRITEIPASRLLSVLTGVLNDNRTILGIFPRTPLILAVSQTNPLIAVGGIRIIGGIVGEKPLAARIREQT